jgi:hypothetical protein
MPINQEDMAGTMMDFSTAVLRGMARAKIKLTPEDREAYLHCWKVVGHLIGVREDLMPVDVKDAFDLAETIIARQIGESDSGKVLAQDLVCFVQGFLPSFLRGFPSTAIRYLSQDQVADTIHSGKYNWTVLLLWLQFAVFSVIDRFKESHDWTERFLRYLTWYVIDKVVLYEEGGEFYFNIPDRMQKNWRMTRR